MKTVTFNENQCVQINNEDEFKSIYPFLRSAKNSVDFDEWLFANKKLPNFPIYLEYAGSTIGYRDTPFCTWTGKPLEILNLNDALK